MNTSPNGVDWSVVVHLVGHHDLYLQLELAAGAPPVLAGHEGHATYSTGKALLDSLQEAPSTLTQNGDQIAWATPPAIHWKPAQFRDRLIWKTAPPPNESLSSPRLFAIRLPILAPVIELQRNGAQPSTKRALILVTSGPQSGQERGASTQTIGELLRLALKSTSLGADLHIEHLHHDTVSPHDFSNLPGFVRRLNDHLAKLRREVVASYADKWDAHIKVALSVSSGPTAMILGLVRGIEEYRPHLLHVADARRWPEDSQKAPHVFKAVRLDTDSLRQNAAVDHDAYAHDEVVSLACKAMAEWQHEFRSLRPSRPADRRDESVDPEHFFWFRKGAQEVLALLVVRDPTDPTRLHTFRGVNLEVSLPTGTLCAERNAIGSAFAAHPTLERKHIAAVAVLSLGKNPRLGPCGACAEWLRKMAEANPDLRVVTFEDPACSRIFVDYVR